MAAFDLDEYRRLRPAGRVGATVYYREQTGSTMDDARTGVRAAGASEQGAVYVAGMQTAGRGRSGRHWVSAPGAGLYATFHLRPPAEAEAPLLGIGGGLAAADAIRETSGLDAELKWPNDLLYQGRKLCGVLAEAQHGEHVDVFLGIGINVRREPLPPEVAALATSIEEAGGNVPRLETLLAALAEQVERREDQAVAEPTALVAEWRSRLVTLGRLVRLAAPGGELYEGEAVDVTPRGELVLRHADGSTGSYAAGDVTTA